MRRPIALEAGHFFGMLSPQHPATCRRPKTRASRGGVERLQTDFLCAVRRGEVNIVKDISESGDLAEGNPMALRYVMEDVDADDYELEFRQGAIHANKSSVDADFDHVNRRCIIATDLPMPRAYRELAGKILDAGIAIGRYRQRRSSGLIPIVS